MSKIENHNETPAEISTICSTVENELNVTMYKTSVPGQESYKLQPEGGRGWFVCLTSMMSVGAVFGLMNSYGIIYNYLLDSPNIVGSDRSSIALKTSLVGSVYIGTFFIMSFFAGIICDRFGIRQTGAFGTVVGSLGLLSSAFVTRLELLYLTFGVVVGIGSGCLFVPSMGIVGHYFKDRIGLASGLVNSGGPLYAIMLSLTLPKLLQAVQFKFTFLTLCGLYLMTILGALSWKPLLTRKNQNVENKEETKCGSMKTIFKVNLLKNRKLLVWLLSVGVAMFGHFIVYVHLIKHSVDRFPDSDSNLLLTVIQLSSLVARLALGKISDCSCVNRVYMHQAALLLNGIGMASIPFTSNFEVLIILSAIIGLSDAAVISLLYPIIVDIVGPKEASGTLGILNGFSSIPFFLGPPVAGFLYDKTGNYTASFIVSGCFRASGTLLMCFMRTRTKVYKLKKDISDGRSDNGDRIEHNGSFMGNTAVFVEQNGNAHGKSAAFVEHNGSV